MKCSFCRNESVYFRKNEGHYYCKNHFIKNIEKRLKREIRINQLIENNDRIAVALSGGNDSANLLFLLTKIFRNNPKIEIFAITLDEGIKGYRNYGIKKSKILCKKIGVKQHIFTFKKEFGITVDELSKKLKNGYYSNCKLLREQLLDKKAIELGATKLAMGHNLNDECENIIMNILRGNLQGLSTMGPTSKNSLYPKFATRIKPLVLIPENESFLYGKINNVPSSPRKCIYSIDNNLRDEARTLLSNLENSSPGLKYSLYENASNVANFLKTNFEDAKSGNR